MKKQERLRARELRKEGKSEREIAKELGVSRGSVSYWVRDVPLTEEQRGHLESIQKRSGLVIHRQRFLEQRIEAQKEGRRMARELGPEYAMGCMLFWAEGTKSGNSVRFTNTDEDMVLFFVRFLKRYFECGVGDFALKLDAYLDNGLTASDLEKFWTDKLGLSVECFRKSIFKRGDGKGGKYPHGVCAVAVHDVGIVQKLYGSIQELAGIEKSCWLKLK